MIAVWFAPSSGSFVSQLVNVSMFWRLRVTTSGSTWDVVGNLTESTSVQVLASGYATRESAEDAMRAIAAGLTPEVP